MFFFQAEDGIRDLVRSRGLGDVYKRQRYDLIPNLVNTIKGYTQYESGTLEKIVELRSRAMSAGGKDGGAAELESVSYTHLTLPTSDLV